MGVLLGGGIDSAALIPFFQDRDARLSAFHFSYGQAAEEREREAAEAISEYYDLPLNTFTLSPSPSRDGFEYRLRNARLVVSLASREPSLDAISLGIHAGTPYPDCSVQHLSLLEELLTFQSGDPPTLRAPWVGKGKHFVLEYAREAGVPLDLTYSCELGRNQPCGDCPTCADLEDLLCV